MGAYPASVSTFTVVGRLHIDEGDSVDVGAAPDVNPQEGVSVTFTPQLNPKRIRVPGFGLVDIAPVAAVTDADGYVKTIAGEDVVLAYGGDPDITPTGWTWLVSIEATSVVPEDEFSIAGSAGGTVDLSEFASVSPADPGAEVVAWVSARDAAIAAKDDAEAAQAAAEAAQAAAEDAQAAAEAVPTSNDGIVAGLVANSESSTRGQLDAAYVQSADIAASALRVGAQMPVLPFIGTRQISTLVDASVGSFGLTWTANPDIEFFDGLWWVAFDGNRTGGVIEGAAGQRVQLLSSPDLVTWTDRGEITAVTDDFHFQPNLKVIGGKLCMFWSHNSSGFLSTLASASSSWVHRRFEWVGRQPVLSTTINGSAESGRTIAAAVDGYTDFALFFAGKPIILRDGTICAPVTLRSNVIDTDAPSTAPTFYRVVKRNAALLSRDGTTWELSQTIPWDPALSFAAGQWEPFPVEDRSGVVRMFSRNNRTTVSDTEAQLVATSFNGSRSYSLERATKLQVPVSRGQAERASSSRWFMAHCDCANNKTSDVTRSGSTRINGNLFVSRDGADNFVPGVPFSEMLYNVVYPQFIVQDDHAYVVFCEDRGNRRCLMLSVISIPTDEQIAYCLPRRPTAGSAHGPDFSSSVPQSWVFDGITSVLAPSALASTDLTAVVYVNPSVATDGTLLDFRQTVGGVQRGVLTLRTTLVSIGSLVFYPTSALEIGKGTMFSLRLNGATGKLSVSVVNGQTTLATSDGYVRSMTFASNPADGDTVVINGVTFTFRTSPSTATDVGIGASKSATCDNLIAKLGAQSLQGYNYTFGSTTRLYAARSNWATFTVTGGSAVSADSNTAWLDSAVVPSIGYKGPITSTILGFQGLLREARIYQSLLTDAELKSVYNARAVEDGYSTISGASAPGASPWMLFDKDATSVGFPSLTAPRPDAAMVTDAGLSRDVMRFRGEISAGIEMPFARNALLIRFKLGALPTGSEKYTIATFGTVDAPVRVQIEAAATTQLRVNGGNAGTIPVNALDWNYLEVIVSDTAVTIFGTSYPISSRRAFLGQAYAQLNLPATGETFFDTTSMMVTEVK